MRRLLAAAVVLALLALACGDDDDEEAATEAGGPPVQLTGTVNNEGRGDLSGEDDAELELEVDDSYFAPTFIRAEPGGTVTVTLSNEGDATHTFTIDELDIDEELQPGDDAEVEITLPSEGALAFYCRFHRFQGMQGAFYDEAGATVAGAGGTSTSINDDDGGNSGSNSGSGSGGSGPGY